jgi:hypothetical protein
MQNAAVSYGSLTPGTPYAELVFIDDRNALARGYIKGYTTIADRKGYFTLLDFGRAPQADVSEPGSLALLAVGGAALGARRRRRSVDRA